MSENKNLLELCKEEFADNTQKWVYFTLLLLNICTTYAPYRRKPDSNNY